MIGIALGFVPLIAHRNFAVAAFYNVRGGIDIFSMTTNKDD